MLLGFNPVASAKPPPPRAGHPARDIVAELGRLRCPEQASSGLVVNPVVGPEPIAGSTSASWERGFQSVRVLAQHLWLDCFTPLGLADVGRNEGRVSDKVDLRNRVLPSCRKGSWTARVCRPYAFH